MSLDQDEIGCCPFCGCDDNFDVHLIGETAVQVECKECLARGPAIRRYGSFPYGKVTREDRSVAIAEWNRRAADEALA